MSGPGSGNLGVGSRGGRIGDHSISCSLSAGHDRGRAGVLATGGLAALERKNFPPGYSAVPKRENKTAVLSTSCSFLDLGRVVAFCRSEGSDSSEDG